MPGVSAPQREPGSRGPRAAIGLIAGAILVQQIALTRLMSVVLWYHFAFVAISLAMLGLALGGIVLYLSPGLLARTPALLPWYCRGAAVAVVAALVDLVHAPPDLAGAGASAGAALLYVVLLAPFACSGLAVSAILAYHARDLGRLYAADLAGAALGCIAVVPLIDAIGAPSTVLLGAVGTVVAAIATGRGRARFADWLLLALLAVLLGLQAARGTLEPTAMHGLPDRDPTTGAPPDFTGWNSHSRVVVTPQSDWAKQINIDGHATTGIYRFDAPVDRALVQKQLNWLPIRSGSMPYVLLGEAPRTLIIGPGGGIDLLNGIYYGARITAVELNGLIHGLMSTGPIADWSGNVYHAPGVQVVHDEARSWIRRSSEQFDLIQASMIDTWAATASGAFSLAENALYTVEAFADYWQHHTPGGLVHFQRWHEQPPRQSLRVLALAVATMRRAGVTDLGDHVVVLEEPLWPDDGPPMASVLWARSAFPAAALQRLEVAVQERQRIGPVKILCWPGRALDNPLSEFLRAPDPDAWLAAYPFAVDPTPDDRPFFFHTVPKTAAAAAIHGIGLENEQAIAVLHGILWAVFAITLAAFLLPLAIAFARGRLGPIAPATLRLAYFACLGVGFMLLEVPLVQRLGLFLGHPTWTLSVVLGSLLLGAGLGGAMTRAASGGALARQLAVAIGAILVAIAVLYLLLDPLLAATLRWGFASRAAVTAAVCTPLGAALGRALPLGMARLREAAPDLVPWAWGINGASSVLASILAVVIALAWGFASVILLGLGCYAAALLLARRLA